MNECQQDLTRLSALADGEASADERAALAAHAAECPRCRSALGALQDLRDRLAARPYPPVRDDEWMRVWSNVARSVPVAGARRAGASPVWVQIAQRRQPALAAAAVLVMALTVGLVTWALLRAPSAQIAVARSGDVRIESFTYNVEDYQVTMLTPIEGGEPVLWLTPRPPIPVAKRGDVRVEAVSHNSDYRLRLMTAAGGDGPVLWMTPLAEHGEG
jgi:hypothetical protein